MHSPLSSFENHLPRRAITGRGASQSLAAVCQTNGWSRVFVVSDAGEKGPPKTGKYGMGWGQAKFDWATEPVITHTGSNGMNLAVAMFWPDTHFGFVMPGQLVMRP